MDTDAVCEMTAGSDDRRVFVAAEHSVQAVTGTAQRHGDDERARTVPAAEGRRHGTTAPALPPSVVRRTVARRTHTRSRPRDGEAQTACPNRP